LVCFTLLHYFILPFPVAVCYLFLYLVYSQCDDTSPTANCLSDACKNRYCDATGTCNSVDTLCDDYNACTFDPCDPVNGCMHNTVNCDDGDTCTTDGCDPLTGCTTTPCPTCYYQNSTGFSVSCTGNVTASSVTVGGAKKRGLSQGLPTSPSFVVHGLSSFSGGATFAGSITTTNLMVSGGTVTISNQGKSISLDPSSGVNMQVVNCNTLAVESSATMQSLLFQNSQNVAWWLYPPGSLFTVPSSEAQPTLLGGILGGTVVPGYKVYLVGTGPKLYEIPIINTVQYGDKTKGCFFNKCKTGTCGSDNICHS